MTNLGDKTFETDFRFVSSALGKICKTRREMLRELVVPWYCCLTACLYAKCCDLIGWILEIGPSIHFRIDGPDHLYGFRSNLKHRIFGKMVEKLSSEVVKS